MSQNALFEKFINKKMFLFENCCSLDDILAKKMIITEMWVPQIGCHQNDSGKIFTIDQKLIGTKSIWKKNT